MIESTKIHFPYRQIRQIDDMTEMMEICFPGNHNQQHAAGCLFFELKWANSIVPNLSYLQDKYRISRRILETPFLDGIFEHPVQNLPLTISRLG